jgi:putative addiction module component (TIGR02574 family)
MKEAASMTPNAEQILRNALDLAPIERAALIEQLLQSFNQEPSVTAEHQTEWIMEARERMAAYENSEISARSDDEVFLEINRKYGVQCM